jgi:AraC-like DNA-binding protein
VATVFCGQAVVEGSPASGREWLITRARQLEVAPEELMTAQRKLPRISRDKLEQVGRLLFLALSHLAETEGRAAFERALALDRHRSVREAIDYVGQHIQDPIRLEDVARHVHLTPAYLSRLFRKITGMTFLDYLTGRRVDTAKELLRATRMTMTDVAFAVGYSHQSYFGRKFRQATGQTPSAFRKANRDETRKPK